MDITAMIRRNLCRAVAITIVGGVFSSELSANLLLNSGFEFPDLVPPANQAQGADDWETFNTAGVRTIYSHSGDQSLRLAPSAPTGTADGIARQVFSASANDVVTFGAWVFNPPSDPLSGTRKAQLRLQWLNANDTLINQTILNVADMHTPESVWINFALVEATLPDNPNITQVRPSLFVSNEGGTGGGVAFFDDIEFINHTAGQSVPEPVSWPLLAIAGLLLVSRRSADVRDDHPKRRRRCDS